MTSKNHSIKKDGEQYRLQWVFRNGKTTRTGWRVVDRRAAARFARKWKIAMPKEDA
jgi:hypothetical protein